MENLDFPVDFQNQAPSQDHRWFPTLITVDNTQSLRRLCLTAIVTKKARNIFSSDMNIQIKNSESASASQALKQSARIARKFVLYPWSGWHASRRLPEWSFCGPNITTPSGTMESIGYMQRTLSTWAVHSAWRCAFLDYSEEQMKMELCFMVVWWIFSWKISVAKSGL